MKGPVFPYCHSECDTRLLSDLRSVNLSSSSLILSSCTQGGLIAWYLGGIMKRLKKEKKKEWTCICTGKKGTNPFDNPDTALFPFYR